MLASSIGLFAWCPGAQRPVERAREPQDLDPRLVSEKCSAYLPSDSYMTRPRHLQLVLPVDPTAAFSSNGTDRDPG